MKKIFTYILLLFVLLINTSFVNKTLRLRDLSAVEKQQAIQAYINGECEYNGIKLYGRVKFVDNFEDISIEYVDALADIDVQFVESFPDECGQWQKVDNFEDIRVKVVSSLPDLTVKVVNSFPGINN